nr:pheromone [Staphylococcus aureus]
YSTCDFIM